jgi:tetratricopeptide (TPR) repeat protein
MNLNKSMNRILMIVILMTITACAGTPKEPPRQAKLYYTTGVEYLRQGSPLDALNAFKEAEKIIPDDPEIQHVIGLTYLNLKIYDEAEKRLKKALELDPHNPQIANNLSSLHLEMGLVAESIRDASLALSNPDYRTPAAAYYNRGMGHWKSGNVKQAKEDFLNAIQIEPLYDQPYIELGQIYMDEGLYDTAIRVLDSAVKVNDKNALAIFRRGMAKWYRGYLTDSENDFSQVLRILPETHPLSTSAREWLHKIR